MTVNYFIEDVDRAFRSTVIAQLLDFKSCCDNSPTWSDTFVSRLCGSVADLDILGFLATELESEKNCAKVCTRIQLTLNSSDVTTARVMANWQALFSLKCEDCDALLYFYLKSKSTLHKLKKSKSIAVTDEVFLNEFFAKVISVEKLQGKLKKLLKGGTETCAEILESIHSNCRAIETGELMRDATDPSSKSLSSRRVLKEDGKKANNAAHVMNIFPLNVGGLLPRTYYSQFRDWYRHMVIPESLWYDSSK